jgi:hypothetical protein
MCLLRRSIWKGVRGTSWFIDFLVGFLGDVSEVWGWEHLRKKEERVMEIEMSSFKTIVGRSTLVPRFTKRTLEPRSREPFLPKLSFELWHRLLVI